MYTKCEHPPKNIHALHGRTIWDQVRRGLLEGLPHCAEAAAGKLESRRCAGAGWAGLMW